MNNSLICRHRESYAETNGSYFTLIKIIAVFFLPGVIALLILGLPQLALADVKKIDSVTYTYSINPFYSEYINISEINSESGGTVRVPAEIDGLPVYGLINANDPKYVNGSITDEGSCKISDNITSLDVSNLSNLKKICIVGGQLTSINLAGLTKLEQFVVADNELTSLDFQDCVNLNFIDVRKNKLTSLNFPNLKRPNYILETVVCAGNSLTSLDLHNFNDLEYLDCSDNNLSTINFGFTGDIVVLRCQNNNLTSLDIRPIDLDVLDCSNNRIYDTSELEAWLKKHPYSIYSHVDTPFSNKVLPQKVATNSTLGSSGNAGINKWVKGKKGWWYSYADGSYAKGLTTIGGKQYFFDSNGWMKSGWQHATGNGDWYYFGSASDGAMKTNKWVKSGGRWYYLDSEGKMLKGKQNLGGVWYYLHPTSGAMLTGWQQPDGSWYYYKSSGAMATGWVKIGSSWYYLDPSSGAMQAGWQDLGGSTYFLHPTSGKMLTGWQKINDVYYYFNKSGAVVKSRWVGNYYVGDDGKLVTSQWVTTGKWQYYVNEKGKWTGAKQHV